MIRLLMLAVVALASLAAAPFPAAPFPANGPLTVTQLREKYRTPADRFVDIGGVEVRYRDEGQGPVVLLLHGSNSTVETWDGVAAKLRRAYRVVRFDHPPVGLSGPVSDAAKATLPGPEALMTGFLARLKIESLIVVGTSSGGTMAYYLAAVRPEMVKALVISNAPSEPLDTSGVVQPPDLIAAIAREKATGARDRDWFRAYFRSLYGRPERITAAQIERNYDYGRRAPETNFLHLFALGGNAALTRERLGQVRAPTLIVWGMRDKVLPWKAALSLRDKLTGVHPSLLLLDDVGHYPPIEVPDRFAAIVDAYVRQVVPGGVAID